MSARDTKRLRDITSALHTLYPEPRSELIFEGEFQLIVAVILSAQCTDKKVNEVTPELFAKFPSFAALAKAPLREIERIIRPVNYYRTKSAHLKEMARMVNEEFGEKVPRDYELIRTLPGVGNKTANVVLGELGVLPTLPVDTHVFRLAHRLSWSRGKSPEDVEEDLKKLFPPTTWRSLHHWLILHGRRVCKAQRPLCADCALVKLCPSSTVKFE